MNDATDQSWTIDQLADRVGMTVRNVRAHQSRGLLPPPTRRGRANHYGPEHEQALLRIRELQAQGYNLTAIAAEVTPDETSSLRRLVLAPLLEHDEVRLSWTEIAGMYGQRPSRDRRVRALATGLVEEDADGTFVAPSRQLLLGARALLDLGVPFDEMFDMQVELASVTREVARRFVEMCYECAIQPFGDRPVPRERWIDVHERFDRLRGLMASVLAATFTVTVRRATEAMLSEQEAD